jgi:hypothetical protein
MNSGSSFLLFVTHGPLLSMRILASLIIISLLFQMAYLPYADRSPAQTKQAFDVISRNLHSLGTNLFSISIGQLGHGLHWLFQ